MTWTTRRVVRLFSTIAAISLLLASINAWGHFWVLAFIFTTQAVVIAIQARLLWLHFPHAGEATTGDDHSATKGGIDDTKTI